MVKNSKIIFRVAKESVYKTNGKVEPQVLILLYGRCKLRKGKDKIGPKMGIGYVFNEEALFVEDVKQLSKMRHTESLVTCEECAFLCVNLMAYHTMADLEGA